MRTGLQLLLLLCGCLAAFFAVDRCMQSRPIVISGIAIDFTTGRPMPHAHIRFQYPNGSNEAAVADRAGRFRVQVDTDAYCCFFYVGPPDASPILQTNVLTNIAPRPNYHHFSGVRVYGAAATQVNGHVFDESGTPLKHCDVVALTHEPDQEPYYRQTGNSVVSDDSGAFTFNQLGSDRYYFVAECNHYLPGEKHWGEKWRDRLSWLPTFYPNARTIESAREVALHPGDYVTGINFHLRAVPQYAVRGSVYLSDGSRPLQSNMYFHDLDIVYVSPDLRDTDVVPTCEWPRAADDFGCDFLPAGTYELRFGLSSGPVVLPGFKIATVPPQGATVRVNVPTSKPMRIQLQNSPLAIADQAHHEERPMQSVIVEQPCTGALPYLVTYTIIYSAAGYLGSEYQPCHHPQTWKLAPGEYRVLASTLAFWRGSEKADLAVQSLA